MYLLLGDSSASEFYVPTFRNSVCSIFMGSVSGMNNRDDLNKYLNHLVPVYLPVYTTYEEGTECSETSEHKIQNPGNHPKERTQHSERGDSLKSRMYLVDIMSLSPEGKRLWRNFYFSPQSRAKAMNSWSCTSAFPYTFVSCIGIAFLFP
jgi:hypothetical protein